MAILRASGGSVPPPEQATSQNWADRSTGPSVTAAYDFASDLHSNYVNGSNGERGFHDTDEKIETAGSIRFELRSGETSANISGSWTRSESPWVMGDSFGEGETFYVQFRQKISQTMIDNLTDWDSFWKTAIFHMNTSTANGVEITTVHPNSQGMIYSDSGAYAMTTGTADPDYENTTPLLIQQAWDLDAGEPWGNETGGISAAYPTIGWDFPGDEWVTCYYKVSLGTFTLNHTGPNDSTIEMWVQEPGNDYWTKLVSGRFALAYNTADTDVYNNITLTPYMTSLSTSSSL